MERRAARADFFDASALVKVFTTEPGSEVVRDYFYRRTTKYTTPFCFYEALNTLKGKWKFKCQLTLESYLKAAHELTAWYGASSRSIMDLNFSDPQVFARSKSLAERFQLDLSDAFQVVSVKHGYFSALARDSATVLVTADAALAEAARSEGLRVWSVLTEGAPQ